VKRFDGIFLKGGFASPYCIGDTGKKELGTEKKNKISTCRWLKESLEKSQKGYGKAKKEGQEQKRGGGAVGHVRCILW